MRYVRASLSHAMAIWCEDYHTIARELPSAVHWKVQGLWVDCGWLTFRLDFCNGV